jgi:aspartate/methionine/tyrosine aminotransferase
MAAFCNRNFAPAKDVLPSHLTVTAGVTAANEMLAWVLGDPGDGFLLGRPYYGTFIMDFKARAGYVKALDFLSGNCC